MAPPPPPPELIDDAIAEILLRLPPDDPACLVRASLVCKLWLRILSESTFPHRYRKFHRTPPLLGFITGFFHTSTTHKRFVPITTDIPFPEPAFGCRPIDCRHGRVLFNGVYGRGTTGSSLVVWVWDPVTGADKLLSDPAPGKCRCSGAVLCAADGCNHHGCHDGPFLVAYVSTPPYNSSTKTARAWVYSSEAAAWSAPASVQLQHDDCYVENRRAAVVRDQIYFLLSTRAEILKYDLGKQCLTMIDSPGGIYGRRVLMAMEDGSSLGFIGAKDSRLHLWARKVNLDGSMEWVQDRVILLNNLVPIIPRTSDTCRLAHVSVFAEGVDIVLLLSNGSATFIFDLKSERFRKLNDHWGCYSDAFPSMAFYIPDFASSKLPQPMETE